jgi:phage tail-like protein
MSGGSNLWPPQRRTPFPSYYFEVEIEGQVYPFKSCSGLKVEQSVVEVEEGGFNGTVHKLPGRTKFSNIVLKMGFCGADSPLYALKLRHQNDRPAKTASDANVGWQTKPVGGGKGRFSGTITQKGPNGSVAKWAFRAGWITKWEGPDLDAGKNEVSIESIEIAHEGVFMLPPENQGSSSSSGNSGSGGPAAPSGG